MKFDRLTFGYIVALSAVLAVLVLGVLWLTPPVQRTGLLSQGLAPLGGLLAAITAAISAKLAYQARTETSAQTPMLSQIQAQTNGLMTVGFSNAIGSALDSRGITIGGRGVAPVAPIAPIAPVAPVAPVLPVLPIAPLAMAALVARLEALLTPAALLGPVAPAPVFVTPEAAPVVPEPVPALVPDGGAPVSSLYGGS